MITALAIVYLMIGIVLTAVAILGNSALNSKLKVGDILVLIIAWPLMIYRGFKKISEIEITITKKD